MLHESSTFTQAQTFQIVFPKNSLFDRLRQPQKASCESQSCRRCPKEGWLGMPGGIDMQDLHGRLGDLHCFFFKRSSAILPLPPYRGEGQNGRASSGFKLTSFLKVFAFPFPWKRPTPKAELTDLTLLG